MRRPCRRYSQPSAPGSGDNGIGALHGDQVIVDRRLAERESVVLEAGSHSESVQMRTADLLILTAATIADLAADAGSAP